MSCIEVDFPDLYGLIFKGLCIFITSAALKILIRLKNGIDDLVCVCLIIINNTLDVLKGCIVDMATVHSLSWTSHIYHNWSVPHGKFKARIETTISQLTNLDWVEGRSLSYWWLLGFDRQMSSSYKTTDITRWDDIIRQVVDIHIQLSCIIQYNINIIPFKVIF